MKVTQHSPVPSQQIEKSQKTPSSDKLKSNPGTEGQSNQSVSGAAVDISPEAQLMKRASEIVMNTPDIRLDKVEQLKKAIKEGTYQIESSQIADRLVDEHFKNHFGKSQL